MREWFTTHQWSAAELILIDVIDAIDGAVHASASIVTWTGLVVVVTTNPWMDITHVYNPTVVAVRLRKITRLVTVQRRDEFPEYALECDRLGVHSAAAFPIRSDGQVHGALTITSADHHGFDVPDLRTGRRATDELAPILAAALTRQPIPSQPWAVSH